MKSDGGVRQRILDAALDIVEAQGINALTQPRLAKAAGLRQSHVTYYFPRKADLAVALLQASHDRASAARGPAKGAPDFDAFMALLKGLMFDRRRMLFFLGIVLAASDDVELQSVVARHARGFVELTAAQFERSPDDPKVIAFIDHLRGVALRMLLEPDQSQAPPDLRNLAAAFGLKKP